jgi:hypothetical protein
MKKREEWKRTKRQKRRRGEGRDEEVKDAERIRNRMTRGSQTEKTQKQY